MSVLPNLVDARDERKKKRDLVSEGVRASERASERMLSDQECRYEAFDLEIVFHREIETKIKRNRLDIV